MTETFYRRILEELTVAYRSLGVAALENAHLVGKVAVKIHHTAYSGCPVRTVRLKFSCAERAFKGAAVYRVIVDRVGLISVGYDVVLTALSYGRVDDKGGILYLALVVRINSNVVAVLNEDTVSGVFASAHYKVGKNRILFVGSFTDDNASANVGVALDGVADR